MPILTVSPKVKLYYEVHGSQTGKPLILIHGLRTTLDWWNPYFIEILISYGNLRVITLDLRGCGRSTNVNDQPFTISDLASDVITLANNLGLDKFCVLGFSYGGRVVQTLLSEYPDYIEKAVLASTICTIKKYSIREFRREQNSREFVLSFLEKFFTKSYIENHPERINDFLARATAFPTSFKTYQLQLKAILSFQGCNALKQIMHPVLVIHGTSDSFIPLDESKKISTLLQNSKLYLVEKAGHFIFDSDKTEEITQVILRFLKGNPEELSSKLLS
ncbi:MAG: alpha/beta fold hydrolase [Candidatus Hodarchaeales archaeon]